MATYQHLVPYIQKTGKKEVSMGILKKSYPYYKRIYGVLVLCILFGLTQGVIGLIEPQIVTLIVDNVINRRLVKSQRRTVVYLLSL